ncbi:MAG: DUF1552 domain-containing protein [Myxococcota bacterium]
MSFKISRRTLLSSAGGFMALPLLEALASKKALAAGTSDPRRLILIHWPNGTVTRSNKLTWFSAPDGPLTAANAPIPLQPFSANLGDITIPKFITQSARDATVNSGAGGHGGAKPTFFTGQMAQNREADASGISGDSFDVMYGKQTPLGKSIYLANSEQGNGDGVEYAYELAHKDGQRLVPEINPISFYNTYFRNLTGMPAPRSDFARNSKILEVPTAAASALRSKLGRADRVRLDSFLSGLSDLKQKLTAEDQMPQLTCTQPGQPGVDQRSSSQANLVGQAYFDRMRAFNDLIAVGFQCDLFRSVGISLGAEGNYTTYDGAYPSELNYNGASVTVQYDHSVSHQTPISGEQGGYTFDNNMTRDRIHLYLLVDLINKLKAASDPSGSKVLDNTMVMAGFCVDDGQHGGDGGVTKGSPIVVAGGKNFMSPGRSFDASHYDLNDLYFTFNGYLGMGLSSFHPRAQSERPYGPMTGRMIGSNVVPL